MALTPKELKHLAPYLQGEHPKANGEWDCICPLHEDNNRSASINIDKRVFCCYMGCGGMSVTTLLRRRGEWIPPKSGGSKGGGAGQGRKSAPLVCVPTNAHVEGWASALLANKKRLAEFRKRRMLTVETIKRYKIGWVTKWEEGDYEIARDAYTIPVFGPDGEILDIRFYRLDPGVGPDGKPRRKIWSVSGMGGGKIYPYSVLADNPERLVICEGELDALICNQNGIAAITRTASATMWDKDWNKLLKGKRLYVIQDTDKAGVTGTNKLTATLRSVAHSVVPVRLPYKLTLKHGRDLTDFFGDGYSTDDLLDLMDVADEEFAHDRPVDLDPADATILDTLDARHVGKAQRLTATVQGKMEPGHSIPGKVQLECKIDKGKICESCPLNTDHQGKVVVEIKPSDPITLALVDASTNTIREVVREQTGAFSCERIKMEVLDYQSVETFFVRPSVDHIRTSQTSDFQTRKITNVGKHDTQPNTLVRITGALYPHPKTQKNEFLSWLVEDQDASLDTFAMTPELAEQLKTFRPDKGQTPLAKRLEIATELAREVTNIHQRDEMHVAMDLVWHSATAFDFDRQPIDRGWVELLVVGDTRTGKSETAKRLADHYRAAEVIDCKASSFAGIVGGLQIHGGGSEFTLNWGVVPMNDRRMVVLDEVGGMTVEQIAQMSSVRSSGIAKITKVKSGETSARTRLLWLGNPRNSGMDRYLYGVDAINPLIGNPEDVARFTLAMAVRLGEVPLEVINQPRTHGKQVYTSELCSALVMWCWSRKRDNIRFTDKATRLTYELATKIGREYIEYPPLIQAANVRVKIATLAVSLAQATFSTDDTYENVIVKPAHVRDAVRFIDRIYRMDSFGYHRRSRLAHEDAEIGRKSAKKARALIDNNPGLEAFLHTQTQFKRQDIEEVLSIGREAANVIVNELLNLRMVSKQRGFLIVAPVLHEILREEA